MERHSDIRNDHRPTSIERALSLIESLAASSAGVSLGELASAAGMPKPTAHRILHTLAQAQYVRSNGDGTYLPGPRLLALAGGLLDAGGYARYAGPALRELERRTPDTIHFAVLIGDEPVYVEKLEGRRPYRMASRIGMPLAFHCTAIGKAILAHLPPDDGRRPGALARLERRTERTIADPAALERELQGIRERGYAVDNEENEDGVRCVGAPVFGSGGRVLGGISVSAPSFHFSAEDAAALAPAVTDAAARVSYAIGGSTPGQAARPEGAAPRGDGDTQTRGTR